MIRIELYGIARQRVGAAAVELDVATGEHRLGDVLCQAACRSPALGEECIEGERLRPAYIANLDGTRFVRDPETLVPSNATLLILSADAGG